MTPLRSIEERNALVEQHAYLVPITRERMFPNCPWRVSPEDIEGEGYVALIHAADHWEPERGVKFKSYAISVIRGAMLEYLRTDDWVSRRVREKGKRIAKAEEAARVRLWRDPTEDEIAAEIGISPEELAAARRAAEVRGTVSMETLVFTPDEPDGKAIKIADQVPDPKPGPEEIVCDRMEKAARCAAVRAAVEQLPARDAEVTRRTFFDGEMQPTIARDLGISVTRVYQLKWRAIGRLRKSLEAVL